MDELSTFFDGDSSQQVQLSFNYQVSLVIGLWISVQESDQDNEWPGNQTIILVDAFLF
jgi:hypothetical protein